MYDVIKHFQIHRKFVPHVNPEDMTLTFLIKKTNATCTVVANINVTLIVFLVGLQLNKLKTVNIFLMQLHHGSNMYARRKRVI